MATIKKPVISNKPVAAKITTSKSTTVSATKLLQTTGLITKTAAVSKPAVVSKTTPRIAKLVEVKSLPGKTAAKPAVVKASPVTGTKSVARPAVVKGIADSTTKTTSPPTKVTSPPIKKPATAVASPNRAAKPSVVISAKGPLDSTKKAIPLDSKVKPSAAAVVRSSVGVKPISSKAVDVKTKDTKSTVKTVPTMRPKPASAKPELNKSPKSLSSTATSSIKTTSGAVRKTEIKSKPVVGASASSTRTNATAVPKSIRTRPMDKPQITEACSDVEICDADSTSSPHIDDFENNCLSPPADLEHVPIDENRLYEVAEEILLTVINVHEQEGRETVDQMADFKSDDIEELQVNDFAVEKHDQPSEDHVHPEVAALEGHIDENCNSFESTNVETENELAECLGNSEITDDKDEHESTDEEQEISQTDENEVGSEDSYTGEENLTAQIEEFEASGNDSEEVATDDVELETENADVGEESAECQNDKSEISYSDSEELPTSEPELASEDHSEHVMEQFEALYIDAEAVPVESERVDDVVYDENENVSQTHAPEDDSNENGDENAEVLLGTDECNDETVAAECDTPIDESIGSTQEVDENGASDVAESTQGENDDSCVEQAEDEPSMDNEQVQIECENDNTENTLTEVNYEIEIRDNYFCENPTSDDNENQKDDCENLVDQDNSEDFVLVNAENADEDQQSLNDETIHDSDSVMSGESLSYAEMVKQPSTMGSFSEETEDKSSIGADDVISTETDANCFEEISLERSTCELVAGVSETSYDNLDQVPDSNENPEGDHPIATEKVIDDSAEETHSGPGHSSAETLTEAQLLFENHVNDRGFETLRKKRSNKRSNKKNRKSNRMSVVEQPQGEQLNDDDQHFYDVEHRPKRRNSKRFRNLPRKQSKDMSDSESNVYTTQLWKNCYQRY